MNEKDSLLDELIKIALKEDHINHDITTNSLIGFDRIVNAFVIAKEDGVIAGTDVFKKVFSSVDAGVKVMIVKNDGSKVRSGQKVINICGKESSILKTERTALNFLQRLSGIATTTHRISNKLKGTGIELLDTRKTTPGMRYLEKDAVLAGGGFNHRMNLEDMAMIKDNHIKMAGSITAAIRSIRSNNPGKIVEVETTTISELKEAIESGADIIMLDNFDIELLQKAVSIKKEGVKYEISGNINENNISSRIMKGIDYISSGALTHSFKSLDLSLKIQDIGGKNE